MHMYTLIEVREIPSSNIDYKFVVIEFYRYILAIQVTQILTLRYVFLTIRTSTTYVFYGKTFTTVHGKNW